MNDSRNFMVGLLCLVVMFVLGLFTAFFLINIKKISHTNVAVVAVAETNNLVPSGTNTNQVETLQITIRPRLSVGETNSK